MLGKLFSRTPEVAIPEIEVSVAAAASRAAGRSDVSNVTGGYIAWEKAGRPTETSARGAA